MFTEVNRTDQPKTQPTPKEGDLFKIIELYGKTFEIRYGFYEERDRYTRFAEPIPCYPDFKAQPQHTDCGMPIVTAIQDVCKHFVGKKDENSTCGDCADYCHHDELLGTCTSPKNKKAAGR